MPQLEDFPSEKDCASENLKDRVAGLFLSKVLWMLVQTADEKGQILFVKRADARYKISSNFRLARADFEVLVQLLAEMGLVQEKNRGLYISLDGGQP